MQHEHLDKFNQRTPTTQMPDIMQLGMNCSCHRTASDTAEVLQRWYKQQPDASSTEGTTYVNQLEFFTASNQRRLFVTAATRQHVTALRTLTNAPQVMQHVDVAVLRKVLKQLVAVGFSDTMRVLLESESLNEAVVQQLTSEAVQQLLQAAVEGGSSACAELLCRLPAAKNLSAESLVQLLQAAVAQNSSACAELLCKLPAATQLTAEALVQLLQAAVARDSGSCTALLCKLPMVKHLQSEALVQLLQAAVEQRSSTCAELLCQLPAANQLPAKELVQLLQAAVAQGGGARASLLLAVMCNIQAAQRLTTDDVAQLLLSAVTAASSRHTPCIYQFCSLPAVQHLTTGSIAQLFLAAFQHSSSAASHTLCEQLFKCPAVQQLSAALVAQLLQATAQLPMGQYTLGTLHGAKLMLRLLEIPAAQELDSSTIVSLLTTTIQQEPDDYSSYNSTAHKLSEVVRKLCCMPGAQKIDVEVAEQLMHAGKQPKHGPCKIALMNLPVAGESVMIQAAALAARMGLASQQQAGK
jgi:hypothetical protein